jgi:hypothetical protein
MKADAHRRPALSLERAIALARSDPTTSVALLENARGSCLPLDQLRMHPKVPAAPRPGPRA